MASHAVTLTLPTVAEVPEGFPSRLSDDELVAAIANWMAEYRARFATTGLPELILAFVNTASQEQLRREANKAAKEARWVAGVALLVSILSLIVALVK
jgi:hypothetical protein